MKKKPEPPVVAPTPEEALERMKALTRRVLAAPKSKITPKRKRRHR
jgi:hypothetical protein